MNDARHLLLHLVADLLRAEAGSPVPPLDTLKQRFKSDCEAVMDDYGVKGRTRATLMTMDRQIIGECVRRELIGVNTGLWPPVAGARRAGSPPVLLCNLADLIRADSGVDRPSLTNLITQFATNPSDVTQAYGINETASCTLAQASRAAIAEHIFREILLTPTAEAMDLWADPIPLISSIDPMVLKTRANQRLDLIADCVLSEAEVHLVSDDGCNHIVGNTSVAQPVGLMAQTITAEFDLSGALPDDYYVRIYLSRETSPIEALKTIRVEN